MGGRMGGWIGGRMGLLIDEKWMYKWMDGMMHELMD